MNTVLLTPIPEPGCYRLQVGDLGRGKSGPASRNGGHEVMARGNE
jgi:hypothetical protein